MTYFRVFVLSVFVFIGLNSVSIAQDMQAQIEELQKQIQALGGVTEQTQSPQTKQDTNLQRRMYIVQRYMVDDEDDVIAQLDELCGIKTKHCQFLSEYWRVAALKSCIDFNNYTLQEMTSFDELSEQQSAFFMNSIEQCNINFYHDEWDDIVETIEDTLELAQKEMKTSDRDTK